MSFLIGGGWDKNLYSSLVGDKDGKTLFNRLAQTLRPWFEVSGIRAPTLEIWYICNFMMAALEDLVASTWMTSEQDVMV